jgi:TetR/AcrR family transcriptional repressor of nem operon
MDTKAALLDSAEHAIRARGYDGFSYADLAAEVGIRKASIHHHFPTKADLALALIARYSDNFFVHLDQISETHPTGGARLKAYISAYRDALDGGRKLCLCVALCTGRDGLSPDVLARLDGFHRVAAGWLGEVFAAGQADNTITQVRDCAAEAEACLAQMEGAQIIARAAGDVGRFDAATARLLDRIE